MTTHKAAVIDGKALCSIVVNGKVYPRRGNVDLDWTKVDCKDCITLRTDAGHVFMLQAEAELKKALKEKA